MQEVKYNILFLGCAIFLLFSACEIKTNNGDTASSEQSEFFKDSINEWISNKNGFTDEVYLKNLIKALKVTEKLTADSLKSVYASRLSLKFYLTKDSVHFKKANHMAMMLAIKMTDSSKIADAYWDRGDYLRNRFVADSAFYNYAQALKIYKKLNNNYNAGRMLFNMSQTLSTIKDYTTAETYAIQAVELFKSVDGDKKIKRLYRCYNQLGIITNNLKDYDKALEYHTKALEYLKMTEDKGTSAQSSKNNIGFVHLAQGKYSQALENFLEILRTDSLYYKNPGLYAKAVENCGYSYLKMGDTTGVRYKFGRAIAIKDSIGDMAALSRSYFTMSEFLFYAKDTLGAMQYAKKAKTTSLASDNNLRVLETLGLLAQIAPKKATDYFIEYVKLNDSLQIAERRSRNKFERIRFETNEALAENVLLSKQNQIWAGIAGILFLLGTLTYIIVNQRRKNEKLRFQEEQQKNNRQIFDLLLSEKSKIDEGKKLAQKRISEELHDAVQSRLQGIRMLLLGLNKRNTPEAIEERAEAIKELKRVQEEVRAISHELSHAAYQRIYSFISTIQELLKQVEKSSALQTKFLFDEAFNWDTLDSDVKINVYRIIQESIQNCVKYAEAERLQLSFNINEDKILQVIIEDNGKGFRPKTKKKGIGIRNIASRVKKLNGEWEIESEIGKGTSVILYIPTLKNEKTLVHIRKKIV